MPTGLIIGIIITVVLIVAIIILYIQGDKLQKKQVEQKREMMEAAQPATMFIIDKKIMPMKDAKFPKVVLEQTPKKYHKAKVPVVLAKIGPQTMSLICDDAIFDDVPVRCEVKAMVSGIYLVSVKSLRKSKKAAEPEDGKKKKKFSLRESLRKRQAEYQKQLSYEMDNQKSKEEIKKEKAKAKKEREREKKIVD